MKVLIFGWMCSDLPGFEDLGLAHNKCMDLTPEELVSLAELYDLMLVSREINTVLYLDTKGKMFKR